jgi:uncharacterized protein (DUF2344 family)
MEHNINDNFFRQFNATTDTTEFMIAIATKVIAGEDLLNYDKNKLMLLFYNMAYTNSMPLKDFTVRIKKFKQAIPNFLSELEIILDRTEKFGKDYYKFRETQMEAIKQLPPLAYELDHPDVIAFIRKLDKDLYNYTQAGELLEITRQTLTTYTNNENHILKKKQVGKSWYITKESIVLFYRDRFERENDYLPF